MIRIKVFYLNTPAENSDDLQTKESFLIQKKSLLKGGFRGFLLDEPTEYSTSAWLKKYEAKEIVEFYIEGSGVYKLANIDLVEGELYFEKSETPVYSKKCIFLDIPFVDNFTNGIKKTLQNKFSNRIKIETIDGLTKGKGAIKLDDEIFKAIRYSLLFIADITPLSTENNKWLANSNVMAELGYALAVKDKNNIIITYNRDNKNNKKLPFDIQSYLNQSYSSLSKDGFNNLFDEINNILNRFGM